MTTGRNKIEIGEYSWVLTSSAAAVRGQVACLDTSTGKLTVVSTSTTLLPVGRFAETMTGDGTKKCRVQLPDGVTLTILNNDSAPNDVDATDIGNTCYLKDGSTVSMLSTGRSAAGIVGDYLADENRVAVLMGLKITGATGASGVAGTVADRAALAALAAGSRADGQIVCVLEDGSFWRFAGSSTLSSDGLTVAGSNLTIEPTAGAGCWIRCCGDFTMRIPIGVATADAAALSTIPVGFGLRVVGMPFWDVTTGWTGGTNSAIGLSASAIASTKGDLLGGVGGELTAVLGTAGLKAGTIGPKFDTLAEIQAFILSAADYLRFDRIASVYTAGAGFVCVPVSFFKVG